MTKDAGQPEELVKARLARVLPRYFLFRPEVKGRGPYQNVVADFWCYPKESLLQAGWLPEPFVIEAKAYDLKDHRKRTAIHVIQQSIVYSLSTFPTKQGEKRPHWVLIHPPLHTLLDTDPITGAATFEGGLAFGLARLAALFNVGEFAITDDGFEVRMHGGTHYSTRRGFNASNKLTSARDVASR